MLSAFPPRRPAATSPFCATLLAAAMLLEVASGELPSISLATVFPPGGRRGTDVELTVGGASLEEIDQLYFSHPGISAKKKPEGPGFSVSIGAAVPAGIYDVRVAGKFGVSNPRVFVVGDLPESVEAKPNDKPEAAVELPVDSLFNGVVAAASHDFFKVNAKKDTHLIVECAAPELDSRLAPVFTLLDPNGRTLQTSRRGGVLDVLIPADGTYGLRLKDLSFGGGPEFAYRLAVRNGPRVEFIFPPAGERGTKGAFTLFGYNLPGGTPASLNDAAGKPLEKLAVEIEVPAAGESAADGLSAPGAAPLEGFTYRFNGPGGTANPQFIGFSTGPVTAEQEPNNLPEQAQKISVPCEVAGQFLPAADSDSFLFEAKKGDVYWVEIFSRRLGLPTSPILVIQRDKADVLEAYGADANVGGVRFDTTSGDPVLRFEAKEDASFRITTRDLFGGTRSDPRSLYRLVVRKESPDFALAAIVEFPPSKADDRTATPRAPLLRGGGTSAIRVIAFRQDNFGGDIELSAEGLPPGVTCAPARILAGKTDAMLLLSAAEDALRWVGAIRIVGKAKAGATELVHEARGGTVGWSIADYNNDPVPVRLTRGFPIALSAAEKAPLSIEPAEAKAWSAPAGGKLEIPLKITRRDEFKEALKLKAFGAPAIETLKEIDADGAAATLTATIDLAAVKIPAGAHTIFFSALTKGKFAGKDITLTVYSSPIEILITAPAN